VASARRWEISGPSVGLSGGVFHGCGVSCTGRWDPAENIFVNTGMLRKNEFEERWRCLARRLNSRHWVDASERFLTQLKGLRTRGKRKRHRKRFIAVLRKKRRSSRWGRLMARLVTGAGTLYPA